MRVSNAHTVLHSKNDSPSPAALKLDPNDLLAPTALQTIPPIQPGPFVSESGVRVPSSSSTVLGEYIRG